MYRDLNAFANHKQAKLKRSSGCGLAIMIIIMSFLLLLISYKFNKRENLNAVHLLTPTSYKEVQFQLPLKVNLCNSSCFACHYYCYYYYYVHILRVAIFIDMAIAIAAGYYLFPTSVHVSDKRKREEQLLMLNFKCCCSQ